MLLSLNRKPIEVNVCYQISIINLIKFISCGRSMGALIVFVIWFVQSLALDYFSNIGVEDTALLP
jgi:hypothetical protein